MRTKTIEEYEKLDVSALRVGAVIKNYKELCKILNEPIVTSNSKKAQLTNWSRFFNYTKDKTKFIITEIYDKPFPLKTYSDAIYIKFIELLMMVEFSTKADSDYMCQYTKTQLYKLFGMVNDNFSKSEKYKYVENAYPEIQFESWELEFFCSRVNFKLSNILFSALRSMKRRLLIEYFEEWIIVQEGYHRVATDFEIEECLTVQKNICKSMGYNIVPYYQLEAYYKKVNKKLNELYGWDYIYCDYRIIFNRKYIRSDIPVVKSEIQRLINENKYQLNNEIIKAIDIQAEKYYEKNQNDFMNHCKQVDNLNEEFQGELYDYDSTYKGLRYPQSFCGSQKQFTQIFLKLK